jgi:toxin ParE1/3/4
MESKVTWSDDALADLAEITRYIARDNPDAAYRFGIKIIEHAEFLSAFPKKNKFYLPEVEGVRMTVFRSYKIYYEYDEERDLVTILNVRHGARLPPDFD